MSYLFPRITSIFSMPSNAIADSALSCDSISGLPNQSVFFAKFMTTNAMSLSVIDSTRTNSQKNIFFKTYDSQMFRINTVSNSTYMINVLAFFNRSLEMFKRNSVNELISFIKTYITISITPNGTSPEPAGRSFIDSIEKCLLDGLNYFKMLRIDAKPVVANMSNSMTVRNNSVMQFIRQSMSHISFRFYSKASVSKMSRNSFPYPTRRCFVNHRKKSRIFCKVHGNGYLRHSYIAVKGIV